MGNERLRIRALGNGNHQYARVTSRPLEPVAASQQSLRIRTGAVISSAIAVVLGIAPHVLHHAGPIAGAALIAGTGGTLIFGAIGLIASVPFLLRVHRRSGGWSVPSALLALFAAGFAVSAFLIGPVIAGDGDSDAAAPRTVAPGEHSTHHQ